MYQFLFMNQRTMQSRLTFTITLLKQIDPSLLFTIYDYDAVGDIGNKYFVHFDKDELETKIKEAINIKE